MSWRTAMPERLRLLPACVLATLLATLTELVLMRLRGPSAATPGTRFAFLLGCNAISMLALFGADHLGTFLYRAGGLSGQLLPVRREPARALRQLFVGTTAIAVFTCLSFLLVGWAEHNIVQAGFRIIFIVPATAAAAAVALVAALGAHNKVRSIDVRWPHRWLIVAGGFGLILAAVAVLSALDLFDRIDRTLPMACVVLVVCYVMARVSLRWLESPVWLRWVSMAVWVLLLHLPWGYGPLGRWAHLAYGDAYLFGWQSQIVARVLPQPGDSGEAADAVLDYEMRSIATEDGVARHLVLITVDALRADHMSMYGYGRATDRNVASFFDGAVQFENCYTTAPNTMPAMASLLTGRYPHRLKWNKSKRPPAVLILESGETLAGILADAGFTTNFLTYSGYRSLPVRFGPGFDDVRRNPDTAKGAGSRPHAQRMAAEAAALIRELATDGNRHFLWLHFDDPHEPYRRHADGPQWGKQKMDLYDGEIRYFDDHFSTVATALAEVGWDQDSLVVLVADHGESFRHEHGQVHHGRSLFQEEIHVPWLMRFPGAPSTRVAEQASLIDVVPTALTLLGVPTDRRFDGRSWTRYLRGEAQAPQSAVVATQFKIANLKTQGYAIIRGEDKMLLSPEGTVLATYDLSGDPREQRAREPGSEQEAYLKQLFRRWSRSVLKETSEDVD